MLSDFSLCTDICRPRGQLYHLAGTYSISSLYYTDAERHDLFVSYCGNPFSALFQTDLSVLHFPSVIFQSHIFQSVIVQSFVVHPCNLVRQCPCPVLQCPPLRQRLSFSSYPLLLRVFIGVVVTSILLQIPNIATPT